MEEPFFVKSRLKQFLFRACDPSFAKGIGPFGDLPYPGREVYYSEFVHNRWPAFKIQAVDMKLDLKYVALNGTIYQTFTFDYSHTFRHYTAAPRLPSLWMRGDMLIRNLDYVNPPKRNSFNRADDASYKALRLDDGRLVREHEDIDGNSAVLCISAFSEGRLLGFSKTRSPEARHMDYDYHLEWHESAVKDIEQFGVLSVTIAYTLEYAQSPVALALPMTLSNLLEESDPTRHPYEAQTLSPDPKLDFCLGRNLEHVLSVCSIPVSSKEADEEPAIALTCGDVDGHFVSTAASFHSFQILLLALRHFQFRRDFWTTGEGAKWPLLATPATVSFLCRMIDRIKKICRGHVSWLLQTANSSEGRFRPYYWISGEEIQGWQYNSSFPAMSLVDAPLQIIKICDFYQISKEEMVVEDKCEIERIIERWANEMDDYRIDAPGLHAFPRRDSEPTRSFYLTDHALVWQALASAEAMGLQPLVPRGWSSNNIRESIFKMFATPNPLTHQHVLAVKRGPAQTRFNFRSKDIALFRAAEMGLFNRPQQMGDPLTADQVAGIWERTLQYQRYQMSSDVTDRNDPRKGFLAIITAQPNPYNYILRMLNSGILNLIEVFSDAGLFPGGLDERSQPVLWYKDELARGEYWSITFEIPFLLWKYSSPSSTRDISSVTPYKLERGTWPPEPKYHFQSGPQGPIPLPTVQIAPGNERSEAHLNQYYPRGAPHIPPNNSSPGVNIRELQTEWLYNRPTFFVSSNDIRKLQKEHCEQIDRQKTLRYLAITGAVVDVPKSKLLETKTSGKKISMRVLRRAEDVHNIVSEGRTAENAKKRFWAFFAPHPSENGVYTSIASLSLGDKYERREIRRFFERHNSYENLFAEETSGMLNTWTTELHLSFYTPLDHIEHMDGISRSHNVSRAEDFCLPILSEAEDPQILRKISMSFHFQGDFFDRYWTCNFLEVDPSRGDFQHWDKGVGGDDQFESEVQDLLERRANEAEVTEVERNSWQQRRVLELILFERMAKKMNQSMRKILNHATSGLAEMSKRAAEHNQGYDTTPGRYESVLDQIKQLRGFQEAIRTIPKHCSKSIEIIEHWRNREKSRELDRPRWTFKDESRYRVIIRKLLASNDDIIQALWTNHDKIANLVETELEQMRGDLEFMRTDMDFRRIERDRRQDENIKRFTLVTTIFVPLGFAASVFSMDQAPELATLGYMIATAAGAFVFTGAMLWILNKNDLSRPYGGFKRWPEGGTLLIEAGGTSSDEGGGTDLGPSQCDKGQSATHSVQPDLPRGNRRSWSIVTRSVERAGKNGDLEVGMSVRDDQDLTRS
ncbi:hypothetical protein CGCTS75_v000416 [Colletotrichum tropicale]|nr:hypothetical protein CGCTS75_v000416 [Colletotrichum tropicale]